MEPDFLFFCCFLWSRADFCILGELNLPLVRELIAGGAPLDAEVRCLRSRGIAYSMFVCSRPEVWGVRMQAFARSTGANASASTAKPSCLHTTPQMWASRNGANEVVKAIVEYWAEGPRGDAES